jgi:hypothetical protein
VSSEPKSFGVEASVGSASNWARVSEPGKRDSWRALSTWMPARPPVKRVCTLSDAVVWSKSLFLR